MRDKKGVDFTVGVLSLWIVYKKDQSTLGDKKLFCAEKLRILRKK